MYINDSVLQGSEKVIFALRQLYLEQGYQPYRMSKFEEYDLYAGNKEFLVSDNVLTFTDTGGKLMALKPDVTLSIIKSSTDAPDTLRKVFYDESVYRVSKGTGAFKEIRQVGTECFGKVGTEQIFEVLSLAESSLAQLPCGHVLAVSDLDIISVLTARLGLSASLQKLIYAAIGEKNTDELEKLCEGCEDKQAAEILRELVLMNGPVKDVIEPLGKLLAQGGIEIPDHIIRMITADERLGNVWLDFSLIDDVNYYNGIIFKGFVKGIPDAVLSGGQYDRLMVKLGRRSKAIGFAVYTDLLDRMSPKDPEACGNGDGFINVALPKGRLGEKVYERFAAAGFDCPSILENNRKLIFENAEKKLRFFWVKPSDVAIYVERGAADIGVAGKDILLEYEPDVHEILDLRQGVCRMAVAAPKGWSDEKSSTLKVATKFPKIARDFYRNKGRDIDIIKLNGSIEIAPILGLSDVIVDIVETGTTLRENDLKVIETVFPISARLIANKSSFKFKYDQIERIKNGLRAAEEDR